MGKYILYSFYTKEMKFIFLKKPSNVPKRAIQKKKIKDIILRKGTSVTQFLIL